MEPDTLVTLLIGVLNAGLSVGLCFGIVLFILRSPRRKWEEKMLKKCPTCERWQEAK